MPILHIIILAIIQGITEFLPVSSSAHLILFPVFTEAEDQGPLIDVAVHLGTLIAVLAYFRKDVTSVYKGTFGVMRGKIKTPDEFFALCLLTATLPVVLLGTLFNSLEINSLIRNNIGLIGWAMLVFGVLLWWADRKSPSKITVEDWTLKQAFVLGLWQTIALIPGTSRSGITITGARFMGFNREHAARLSMLMSIPVIIAASTLSAANAIHAADFVALRNAVIAALLSAIAAYLALFLMMLWLKKINFTPYVIYRIIFGAFLIWWAYS